MSPNTHNGQAVQKFIIGGANEWMEYSGVSLADVINEDETKSSKLGGVGFGRAPKGSSTDFEFAYDEVLVVTKGSISVSSQGKIVTMQAGEIVYLPAGIAGVFMAVSDAEFVYVASSPYGEVNRDAKASLLATI